MPCVSNAGHMNGGWAHQCVSSVAPAANLQVLSHHRAWAVHANADRAGGANRPSDVNCRRNTDRVGLQKRNIVQVLVRLVRWLGPPPPRLASWQTDCVHGPVSLHEPPPEIAICPNARTSSVEGDQEDSACDPDEARGEWSQSCVLLQVGICRSACRSP